MVEESGGSLINDAFMGCRDNNDDLDVDNDNLDVEGSII